MMNFKSLVLTAGIAVTGLVASGAVAPAQAFTTYFGEDQNANSGGNPIPNSIAAQANFFSQLNGVGTETFEGFTAGTTASPTPINLTFPGVGTATLSGPGSIISGSGAGRFPVSGTNSYEVSGTGFTVNFSSAVAAFGFYGLDIGDFNGQITLTLNNGSNTVLTVPNTLNGLNGSALYFGLIAQNAGETFTSVTFGNTSPGTDIFGFDDLTIGTLAQVAPATDVPEPFTIIGTLVGGSAALRMRKKLKSN